MERINLGFQEVDFQPADHVMPQVFHSVIPPEGVLLTDVDEPVTGMQQTQVDYEGFSFDQAGLVNGRGSDYLPRSSDLYTDVNVVPSWPHNC